MEVKALKFQPSHLSQWVDLISSNRFNGLKFGLNSKTASIHGGGYFFLTG